MPKPDYINWGCCDATSDSDEHINCALCKKAYHSACLPGQVDPDSRLAWRCPLCMNIKARRGGNRDDIPVRSPQTPLGKTVLEPNVTARSNKRPALFSPPDHTASAPVTREVIQHMMDGMLAKLQLSMADLLNDKLKPIREEIQEVKESMSFINDQYEDFIREHRINQERVQALEEQNEKLKSTVKDLSDRINNMEQHARANNLEIQCLPENKNENLFEIASTLGSVVGCDIKKDNILHVTRIAKIDKSGTRPRSIVVQCATPKIRDEFLAANIKFNRNNPNNKLNSRHLGIEGEIKPIYVMEHLSPYNKQLHAAARIKAKELGFKYVWTRNGKIFMRKNDSSPFCVIYNRNCLDKLI